MNQRGQQYERNRDYHRPGPYDTRRAVSSRPAYSSGDYLFPVLLLCLGVAVLAGTIVCASLGVFGRSDARRGLPGIAAVFASSSVGAAEPSDTERLLREWQISEMIGDMTVEQKVGQLLLLRSHDLPDEEFFAEISDLSAGGVVLFANDIKGKDSDRLTEYIGQLQRASDGHMLICVDEEGGSVVRVSSNRLLRGSSFRSPQKLYAKGGLDYISYDAAEKAGFLRQFGFNVNFAPVADVVTDPEAMMYSRAFGRDAAATSEYVSAVVTASEAAGVGTCLKHFPGYGNTAGDTHNGIVSLDTSLEQLRQSDLLPFEAGISAGSGAVMVTHTIMTAIDPERPASMSPAVISILRGEMGFDGVIISDGMDMGAISAYSGDSDVCVASFLAGIDLMCTPSSGREAHAALAAAVSDGTITMERLDQAVTRILRWKFSLGLYPAGEDTSAS